MDPDLEGLFTPSSHPSTGSIIDAFAVKTGKPTRNADAMNAYWHVDETEEVYYEAPPELIERLRAAGLDCDILLRGLKKQYGKRDASVAYSDWLAGIFCELGFDRCQENPLPMILNNRTFLPSGWTTATVSRRIPQKATSCES